MPFCVLRGELFPGHERQLGIQDRSSKPSEVNVQKLPAPGPQQAAGPSPGPSSATTTPQHAAVTQQTDNSAEQSAKPDPAPEQPAAGAPEHADPAVTSAQERAQPAPTPALAHEGSDPLSLGRPIFVFQAEAAREAEAASR